VQEAVQRVARRARRVAEIRQRIDHASDRGLQARRAGRRPELWQYLTRYLSRLAQLEQQAIAERVQAERELTAQREHLLELQRDREVLDRLRDHQQQTWAMEQRRREIKEMDEIASIRAASGAVT